MPWETESSFVAASVVLANLEHSPHAQRAVELAVEGQFPRGGKSDVQLHLALGRDVLVDAEGGDRDVVQSTRLALHHERQLLTRAAPQEGGLEVIVVSLQLELRQLPHVLGPVVSVGHAVQRDGLARLTLGGRRRRGARGGRGGSGLYGDLSRRVARRNRGQHPATGQVHHRDVIGGLVGHVGGGPSELDVLQCGALPTGTVPATVVVAVSRIASSPGPWTTARAQRPSGVKGA